MPVSPAGTATKIPSTFPVSGWRKTPESVEKLAAAVDDGGAPAGGEADMHGRMLTVETCRGTSLLMTTQFPFCYATAMHLFSGSSHHTSPKRLPRNSR